MIRTAIPIFALVFSAPLASQSSSPESRYTLLDRCDQIADGMDSEDRDWVSFRCEGFEDIPVWLTFADSTRSYLGFGKRENLSGIYNAARDEAWPVEWRGMRIGNDFRPFAVIVRMQYPDSAGPDDGQSYLFVYRLRGDDTSCLVASGLKSNVEARHAADDTRNGYACEVEPRLPR